MPDGGQHQFNTTTISTSTSVLGSTMATGKSTTTTEKTLKTLKLEDYDEFAFDLGTSQEDLNDANEDDEKGENSIELSRKKRENEDMKEDSNDEMESTTIESSTQHVTVMSSTTMMPEEQQEESSDSSHAITISSMLEIPQNPSQGFSSTFTSTSTSTSSTTTIDEVNYYPPSRNPTAQYTSITYKPQQQSTLMKPVKNFYDFLPSQPDFYYHHYNNRYHHYIPFCINLMTEYQKFKPIIHDTGTWFTQHYK